MQMKDRRGAALRRRAPQGDNAQAQTTLHNVVACGRVTRPRSLPEISELSYVLVEFPAYRILPALVWSCSRAVPGPPPPMANLLGWAMKFRARNLPLRSTAWATRARRTWARGTGQPERGHHPCAEENRLRETQPNLVTRYPRTHCKQSGLQRLSPVFGQVWVPPLSLSSTLSQSLPGGRRRCCMRMGDTRSINSGDQQISRVRAKVMSKIQDPIECLLA